MRAMGGGESYESSPHLGCARLKKKRREIERSRLGVQTKKKQTGCLSN